MGRKRRKRQLQAKKQQQQPQQQQPQQESVGGAKTGAGPSSKEWVHPFKRRSSFPSLPVLMLTQHIEVSADKRIKLLW